MENFTVEAKCSECKGTGLYSGMAESDTCAVVCHRCKGTGCATISINYEPFVKRLPKTGIKRVYNVNVGIKIGESPEKGIYLEDFGGVSYTEWVADPKSVERIGTEDRRYTCPTWYYQTADYKKKPNWKECLAFGGFSSGPSFNGKASCWRRFDAEQGR